MANAFVSFVMLGLIPGTHIQLSFRDWIFAVLISGFTFALITRLRPMIGELVAHVRHTQVEKTVVA